MNYINDPSIYLNIDMDISLTRISITELFHPKNIASVQMECHDQIALDHTKKLRCEAREASAQVLFSVVFIII